VVLSGRGWRSVEQAPFMQIFVKVRHHANYHTRARRLTAPAQGGSGGGGTQRGQPRAAHAGSAAIGALPCLRAALGGQQFKHVHGGGRCSAPAVDSNRWAGCGSGGPRHRDASVSAARSLLLDPSRAASDDLPTVGKGARRRCRDGAALGAGDLAWPGGSMFELERGPISYPRTARAMAGRGRARAGRSH
jgi:hypothetical protein